MNRFPCSRFPICFFLFGFVPGLLFQLQAEEPDGKYVWKPMKIGGGGWVVGMDIHPSEKDLLYIRTDVAGAYRWDPATSSWKQIVTAESMPAEIARYGNFRGVESLVGAPGDADVAYMAYEGEIFRSSNRGNSWETTSFAQNGVKMEPNGDGRQDGERLAVDPANSRIVYFASIKDGLWRTEDGGASWTRVEGVPTGQPPHGITTVLFDGTSGTGSDGTGIQKTKAIYATLGREGIFKSEDAGTTWKNISVECGPAFSGTIRDAEIGPDGTFYVACEKVEGRPGALWKLPQGGEWQNITPESSEAERQAFWDVAVNPLDSKHLALIQSGGACFVSKNGGTTWSSHGFDLTSPDILWLGSQDNHWLSVGEIAFDPHMPERLWFAEGFGVWRTDDLESARIPWRAESAGIEETCGNDIICPPGGKPIAAMWDIGVFRFDNPDTYNAQRAAPYFMSAWDLDWCASKPEFIAAVFRNHNGYGHINETGYSNDGGLTWNIFPAVANQEIPADLEYGVIAVSADRPENLVWCPAGRKLPFFSTDLGKTWAQTGFPDGISSTGFDNYYSPQKPLATDRVLPATFYFYHTDEGLFRSEDGGASFKKTSGELPLGRKNSVLKAVPGKAGHLLFAEGHQGNPVGGIWHSTDGGNTWKELPFIEQAFNFGLGKSKEEGGFPTIFVAGIANDETGIFRSTDGGDTWAKIAGYPLGIFDWIDAMDGDKDTFGKVYLAFTSSGFAYGEEMEEP